MEPFELVEENISKSGFKNIGLQFQDSDVGQKLRETKKCIYKCVYPKHLRLMSGRAAEGSASSFPATFNRRVFQVGKQRQVSAIVGSSGVSRTTVSTLLFVSLSRGWPCRFFSSENKPRQSRQGWRSTTDLWHF